MAIRHKRKNTAAYAWQAGDLVEGQLGLNIADGTLHFQKSNGDYVKISEDDIKIASTDGNASDTTLNVVLVPDSNTGFQKPHVDSGLTYNASTNALTATTFVGELSGNATTSTTATTASTVTLTADNSTNATNYPLFTNAATGDLSPRTDTGFTYNPSTGTLAAVTFAGALSGNATTATTANNASNINIASIDGNTGDTAMSVVLVPAQSTGNQAPHIDGGLTYNASTNALTATTFVGALSGNATTATTATNATNINISNAAPTDTTMSIVLVPAQSTGNQSPQIDAAGLSYNANTNTLILGEGSNQTGSIQLFNGDTDNGITITTPSTIMSGGYTLTLPQNDGNANQVLTTNGSGVLSWTSVSGSGTVTSVSGTGTVNGLTLTGTVTTSGSLTLGGTLDLSSPPAIGGTSAAAITGTTITANTQFTGSGAGLTNIPNSALTNSAITINGTAVSLGGTASVGTVTSVGGTGSVNGLTLSGTVTSTGNLTLGGTLDLSSPPAIGGTTAAAGTFTNLTSTGILTFKEVREALYDNGNSGAATITPNAANGSVQKYTLTGNITLNAFASPVAGQSITLILVQDGTGGKTLTSTMKWAGGTKTLSTAANSVDIATIYYDGTNYWASLNKGFA